MMNLDFNLHQETEQKMRLILDQYEDKEVFFQDVIAHQIHELKNGIHNIEIDLQAFSQKYNLSSETFYRLFQDGELEDNEDFIIWSGIYEMQLENRRKLRELE